MPNLVYSEGGIKIFCGDSTEMIYKWGNYGDQFPDVLITDPPYGMAYRVHNGTKFDTDNHEVVANDRDTVVRDQILEQYKELPALVFGIWSQPRPAGVKMLVVWDKITELGSGDLSLPWKPNHEEIYVIGRGFTGYRGSGVLHHKPVLNRNRTHPTEKPLGLLTALIEKCPKDWVVFDPFMGTGSTLVAAKALGRRAVGCELRDDYCEIAGQRLDSVMPMELPEQGFQERQEGML